MRSELDEALRNARDVPDAAIASVNGGGGAAVLGRGLSPEYVSLLSMTDDETPLTDAGRQSAHVLLDAIAGWDGANPNDFAASDLAAQRLLDIGAIKAEPNTLTGNIDVDISAVLQGATITMVMLIASVAALLPNATMLDVIAKLREQIEQLP